MRALIDVISRAETIQDMKDCLARTGSDGGYQIAHIGIGRLDDVPVKCPLFTREMGTAKLSYDAFPDTFRWALYRECEALMRPFDFMTHDFVLVDSQVISNVRAILTASGLRELILFPQRIKSGLVVVLVNFPDQDYKQQAGALQLQLRQLISTIFDRFPTLAKWPDDCRLSPREKEVLQLSAKGLTESEVAEKLGISPHTVRKHVENSKLKLDARNKLHAVSIAIYDNEIMAG